MERTVNLRNSQIAKNARLYLDRESFLDGKSKIKSYLEIGVYAGDYTDLVINSLSPNNITLIDWFGKKDFAQLGSIQESRFSSETHKDFIINKYSETNATVLAGNSHSILIDLIKNNQTFEYIYIDADHSFAGCYGDLLLSSQLIDNNGIIGLNDFTMLFWEEGGDCGVVDAVSYFLENNQDWEIIGYALNPKNNYYGDIYLQKATPMGLEPTTPTVTG